MDTTWIGAQDEEYLELGDVDSPGEVDGIGHAC
jgi:hypothetical protein